MDMTDYKRRRKKEYVWVPDSPFRDGSVEGKNNHYKIRGYKEKDANEVISVLSFLLLSLLFFCFVIFGSVITCNAE